VPPSGNAADRTVTGAGTGQRPRPRRASAVPLRPRRRGSRGRTSIRGPGTALRYRPGRDDHPPRTIGPGDRGETTRRTRTPGCTTTEQNGEKDPHTPAQRNVDALGEVLDIALSTDRLPRAGGQRPHITVTVTLDDLQQRLAGNAPTAGILETTGQPLTATQIRRLTCDAEILPMVLGGDGQPLDVGRAERTAPPHIRAALLARDGNCSFPGCDHPAGTPEAHHARHWVDGGETSLANMAMLCSAHHRIVHNQGWKINFTNGRPIFIPPSTVDPWHRARPGNRPLHQLDLAPLIAI
jgi:hypothetical protein